MKPEKEINPGVRKPARNYVAVLYIAPDNRVLLANKAEDMWCLQARSCSQRADAHVQTHVIAEIFNLVVTGIQATSLTVDIVDSFDQKVERYQVVLAMVKQASGDFLRQSVWYEAGGLPEGLSEMAKQAIDLAYTEGALSEVEQLAA